MIRTRFFLRVIVMHFEKEVLKFSVWSTNWIGYIDGKVLNALATNSPNECSSSAVHEYWKPGGARHRIGNADAWLGNRVVCQIDCLEVVRALVHDPVMKMFLGAWCVQSLVLLIINLDYFFLNNTIN